jgi:acyl carrier protein
VITTELLDEVSAIVSRLGKVDTIGPDDDFYNAVFSSINALELLLGLEENFGVSIPDEQFIESRTVRSLSDMITKLRQG